MKQNNQTPDPMTVRHEAERLGLNPLYFSNIHNRSMQRIYDAYKGKAPELLAKMWKHVQYRKSLKSKAA